MHRTTRVLCRHQTIRTHLFRNLPHGIQTLHPAFSKPAGVKSNPDDDILYSVNQRFAYTEPGAATAGKPKNVRIPSKYKNNKMTVRLRPRQVLCSKCKGICNENSENVSKKRKVETTTGASAPVALSLNAKRSADAPVTRSVYSEQKKKGGGGGVPVMRATLIPKVCYKFLNCGLETAINQYNVL